MEGYLRKRGVRLALLTAIVLASLAGVYLLRSIFAPLILGFLIAYVLDPLADALEARRFSRLGAVLTIFGATSLLLVAALTAGSIYIVRGIETAYFKLRGEKVLAEFPGEGKPVPGVHFEDVDGDGEHFAGYLARLQERIADLEESQAVPAYVAEGVEEWIARRWRRDLSDEEKRAQVVSSLDSLWRWLGERFEARFRDDAPGRGAERAQAAAEEAGLDPLAVLSYLVLCPLYVFFFLLQIDPMIATVRRYLPARQRARIERITGSCDRILAAFFRGRLTVCLVKGALTALGLLVLDVPFWFPLGMGAGFLALIPYVGIYISMVPAVLLSYFEHHSVPLLVAVLGVYALLEAVEGFVLIPRFLGREVGLHPLTIIVTLLVFGKLFGFVGVLLSVPLAAITKILAAEFVLPLIEEFASESATPEECG